MLHFSEKNQLQKNSHIIARVFSKYRSSIINYLITTYLSSSGFLTLHSSSFHVAVHLSGAEESFLTDLHSLRSLKSLVLANASTIA